MAEPEVELKASATDMVGVVESGAELSRSMSRHGPEYDALLAKGIPRSMLRPAWIVSNCNADLTMDFIRANFDQTPDWWSRILGRNLHRFRTHHIPRGISFKKIYHH